MMMKRQSGFTLLEIMLVILVIGLLAGVAAPNFSLSEPEDRVAEPARRFKAVFDMAADYAMLNQYELGIIIKDNNYRFVAFDGERWVDFQGEKIFTASDHEEGIQLDLELEGLPWAEENLVSEASFQTEEDEQDEDDDTERLSPQLFILSSGDITPFRLTFSLDTNYGDSYFNNRDFTDDIIYFQVTGDFTTPVTIEGPMEQLP